MGKQNGVKYAALAGAILFAVGLMLIFLGSSIGEGIGTAVLRRRGGMPTEELYLVKFSNMLGFQIAGAVCALTGGLGALLSGGRLSRESPAAGTKRRGLHHVSLKACGEEQFRQVLAFYRDVLGCPLVRAWGEGTLSGAMLDLGGALLEVTASGAPGLEKGVFGHIAFAAEDVDAVTQRVHRAGFEVFMEPSDRNLGGVWPVRVAFCRGPAGEDVEFFQERGTSSENCPLDK